MLKQNEGFFVCFRDDLYLMTRMKNLADTHITEGDLPNTIHPASTSPPLENKPKQVLSVTDAVLVIVGIVVGAGIFKTPSIVAADTGSEGLFFGVWALGGVISLIGAMCYAELTTTFPNTGGDYHFIHRAFGPRLAFLFAWARLSIIQTGSIALLAFIVGDYMSEFYLLCTYSSSIYAGLVIVALTAMNIIVVQVGTRKQKLFVTLQFVGLLILVVSAF